MAPSMVHVLRSSYFSEETGKYLHQARLHKGKAPVQTAKGEGSVFKSAVFQDPATKHKT